LERVTAQNPVTWATIIKKNFANQPITDKVIENLKKIRYYTQNKPLEQAAIPVFVGTY
ncbi:hypothetical protein F443_01431, partial [Phytophthora nicotianae P1569]